MKTHGTAPPAHPQSPLILGAGARKQFRSLLPLRVISTYLWVVVKIMVPFLGPYYNKAPIVSRTQTGTILLTTTHIVECKRFRIRAYYYDLGAYPP